jgi:uncharacterized protein YdhG (YjbR/CyaY superfamily)
MRAVNTIDSYNCAFPHDVYDILEKLRQTIKKAAPDAKEAIAYGIPTFKLNGNLVHFGGYKNHVSFYPGSEAIEIFKKELAEYECSKGTIKFPLGKPIPYALVAEITKYRVKMNVEKKLQ